MSTLLLLLTGPMQSWGASSRFAQRATENVPTKSGVLGLLAAAQGRRRTDSIEDLVKLRFGVRVEASGSLLRDFQTAQSEQKSLPLTYRYYLSDATFLAGVEGDDAMIEGLHQALRHPAFPLYLGRRSCPPSRPVAKGIRRTDLETALRDEPWLASERQMRTHRASTVRLRLLLDAEPGEDGITMRDVPLSYDPRDRQYGWRTVTEAEPVAVDNPVGHDHAHDPIAECGG
ncbi:type I-E CRISPR-associated protein Cas5/CasD [Aeromicrobium camelliae]|uniref:Type I-E CRISPR-associated protein Cas5/CasD n=1 Tax=Aeromicrobium camelliae TaxID=1538144 RepID=A0A3N6ZP05_9ACTN|nr:type I-E CRISPR-associated protein Cas5/CasD [Aeromicrobium camelliae]RQN08797.1 type I-E CRISPR-associated protein Cas5/CasD [Aeromicrobium camelliae]